nr:hypothetical protein [Tanacetum cinerariifolium]
MNNTKRTPTIIRNRTHRAQVPIAAPDIAVAFHDEDSFGLIPVADLDAPITVDLRVWEGAEPGYFYQLMWDGKERGLEKAIPEFAEPGDPLTLELTTDLQTEGSHSLGFKTRSSTTGVEDYSAIFPVIIDRTAPGKPDLAAIQFPVEDFLESITEGPKSVKYTVTDRAGNVSDDSIAVEILLLLEEIPADYPAPVLDPAVGDLIDYSEARPGVQVDIPHYPGATAFDQ